MLSFVRGLVQLLSLSLLLTIASVATAQTSVTCGIVGIDGPSEVDPNVPMVFKAKTAMLHTTKPEFKWKLSVGAIATGQGTDEITVDAAGLAGQDVTVTVELSGAAVGCKAAASKTAQVKPAAPTRCAFDTYGDIKFADEDARLDNFAIQLTNLPLSSGHIFIWAGQKTFEKEAEERLRRAKSYLTDVRAIDPNRVVTVDCGFSKELTAQLWVVPVGAAPPACTNSVAVPFSDVKFTKPRMRRP